MTTSTAPAPLGDLITSSAFTPKAISSSSTSPKSRSRQGRSHRAGVEMDFIDAVAAPVPMRVIAEMLGVSIDLLDDFGGGPTPSSS